MKPYEDQLGEDNGRRWIMRKDSKGVLDKIYLCTSRDEVNMWTCSFAEGHLGEHKAYGSHVLHEDYYRASWPGDEPPTQDEIDEALRSIETTVRKQMNAH